ncbi:ROK family transcriptional regulator [Litoribacter alkaliphilus]|uniref:ROK family transcriptional regulator n=1 Tax=Litoribacter ruber TaxID=702568 RepID=A0AAP2G2G3_9BACT|nr:ROK family transcriptional regulator [Litoribacter alkaliphilus]MBS9525712.1 ROK family transcriptional regulator [Litoribacter alkaliphilus]
MINLLPSSGRASGLKGTDRKRVQQKIKVIKTIYTHGYKTAMDICQELQASLPTITNLINEMLTEELIERKGKDESSGGRKPDLYGLKDNSIFILAINVGQNKTQMAIFNNNHQRISEVETFKIKFNGQEENIQAIYELGQKFLDDSQINQDKLLGIGVTMPGLVDSKKGINYSYFGKLSHTSLKSTLEAKFNKQVVFENDAKAMTLAEYKFGSRAGSSSILGIYNDWGIGLGMVLEGKIYKGFSGFSGEFGHITMENEGGRLCVCGKQGCLETVASGMAMVDFAREGFEQGKKSIMNAEIANNLDGIDPDLIIQSALRGDQHAISILNIVGTYMGRGIAVLIQLLNPEHIIIGGKIAEAGGLILPSIHQALNIYSMPQIRMETKIEVSTLGREARMLGAISVFMEEAFDSYLG